ncbi:MAG: ArdC family protein, partial [Spirochaetaceae bacterium]|nr:ArdC family protein [Spirochaetaceae bacterium]
MPSGSPREQNPIPADFFGVSQNDLAIISAKHDRKQFIAALDSGARSCLTGRNGLADTQPARNAVNRTAYRGSSQLLLKIFQKQNGFPTAEYCTFDQVEKAARGCAQLKNKSAGAVKLLLADADGEPGRIVERQVFSHIVFKLHGTQLLRLIIGGVFFQGPRGDIDGGGEAEVVGKLRVNFRPVD